MKDVKLIRLISSDPSLWYVGKFVDFREDRNPEPGVNLPDEVDIPFRINCIYSISSGFLKILPDASSSIGWKPESLEPITGVTNDKYLITPLPVALYAILTGFIKKGYKNPLPPSDHVEPQGSGIVGMGGQELSSGRPSNLKVT